MLLYIHIFYIKRVKSFFPPQIKKKSALKVFVVMKILTSYVHLSDQNYEPSPILRQYTAIAEPQLQT